VALSFGSVFSKQYKRFWRSTSKKQIFMHQMPINMRKKAINRLKAVLAEQGTTNKWLAEKLNKNETTISRWCTNEVQPSMDNLVAIASLLKVDVRDLINSTKTTR
jgi:putative transcriptional regulator